MAKFFNKKTGTEEKKDDINDVQVASISSEVSDEDIQERRQLAVPIVVSIIGLTLNMGGKIISNIYGLPIYLDTIGTILVSILGGFVPGITVALSTNMLSYFMNPSSIYFGPLNILISIITVLMNRKGMLKGIKNLFIYIVCLTLAGGGAGGILSWLLYGYDVNGMTLALAAFFHSNGLNNFLSYYFANFAFDFLDKVITVTFVMIALYLIPEEQRYKFEYCVWFQKPMSKEETDRIYNISKNKFPLRKKIVVIYAGFAIAISLVCIMISLFLFRKYSIEQHTYLAESIAHIAAATVNGDEVNKYLDEGGNFDSYVETENALRKLLDDTRNLEYLYVYKVLEDGCHVIFDFDSNGVKGAELGEIVTFDTSFLNELPDLLSGKRIEPVISNDTYGWLLTAYEPVYNSNGECVCYAGVDISMYEITKYESNFFIRIVCMLLGFMMLFIALAVVFTKYNLVLPINSTLEIVSKFSYEDEYELKLNFKKLNDLDITTGDEIEDLYHGYLVNMSNGGKLYEDSRQKMGRIYDMQKSLVMVLADLAETRQLTANDHVHKTSEYVSITAHKMRELGYYKDQLTNEFIDDVTRSAPLHDIGKITIPETILNKPGKLTDEEFEIMKTHTIAGCKIIERAKKNLPDTDYLEEAGRITLSHHERWDGKGYPEGISGEDIPLSARIMAVADVFDALISKKSYKESMSYETAFNIIKEGSGQQFDPFVAGAFLQAKDAIIQAAEKNNDATYDDSLR